MLPYYSFRAYFCNSVWLLDRISYNAHVCVFHVVFCTLSLVFGNIGMRRVSCMSCVIVLSFSRIVLAVTSGYLIECGMVRMCVLNVVFRTSSLVFLQY